MGCLGSFNGFSEGVFKVKGGGGGEVVFQNGQKGVLEGCLRRGV